MKLPTSVRILVRAVQQFSADGVSQMGAALAYYALFSTAPLLILAVLAAGMVFGEEAAHARVEEHLTDVFGPASARKITAVMDQAIHPARGGLAAIAGIAALAAGALGAFLHVRQCLCVIWRLTPPGGSGLLGTLLNYALAILMVLCVGLLLLLSLAVSTALPVVIDFFGDDLPGGATFWQWFELGFSFVLLTLFFAVVYRVLSGQRIAWRYIIYGSFVSSLLFAAGKILFGLYLAYSSTTSVYGAAGALVLFLVWVYYSAQIFFFGAELVQARRTRGEWLNGSDPAQQLAGQ